MKKAILTLVTAFSMLAANAQITWNCGSFSCSVPDTNLVCSTNSTTILNCTLTNFDCCNSINITQIIGSFNLPAGWSVTFCNPNGCFGTSTTSNTFIIPPSSTVTAKFEIHAGSNAGSGTVSARFEDAAAPTTNGKTFTIVVNPSSTGIASVENSNLSLSQNFPNPFLNTTTIKYNLEQPNGKIVISDVSGKIVSEHFLSSNSGEIILNEQLQSGTYFYSLYSNDKIIATNKMVVQ